MSADIAPWPKNGPITGTHPMPIKRPCDYGLDRAISDLETQLGSIEAYNRLCAAADRLRAKIDAGHAKPQNPLYAVSPKG